MSVQFTRYFVLGSLLPALLLIAFCAAATEMGTDELMNARQVCEGRLGAQSEKLEKCEASMKSAFEQCTSGMVESGATLEDYTRCRGQAIDQVVAEVERGSDTAEPGSGSQAGGDSKPDSDGNPEPTPNPSADDTPAPGSGNLGGNSKSCVELVEDAKDCCTDPMKCNGMDSGTGETVGMATQMILSTAMGVNSMSEAGVKKNCEIMKYAGGGSAAINAAFAGECGNAVDNCVRACTNEMNSAPAANQSRFRTRVSTCSSYRKNVAAMGQNAAASLYASQMGKLCAKAAATTPADKAVTFTPPPEICAADPANPLCRPADTKPSGDLRPPGNPNANASSNSKHGDFNTLTDDAGDPGQSPVVGGGTPIGESHSAGVPNGGGGMLGGGGGGGQGGGGGGSEKGARNAASASANILQGERGGGGYSGSADAPAGGGGGGGWVGYAQPNAPERERSGLDLSRFLPGGADKDAQAVRGVAGIGRATVDIGTIHEDIFKKITDRVQFICRMKRLECD